MSNEIVVALVGLASAVVVAFVGYRGQRIAGNDSRELSLFNQVQEERDHAQRRVRDLEHDLFALRDRHTRALEQLEEAHQAAHDCTRRCRELEAERDASREGRA